MSLVNQRLANPPIAEEPKQFLKAIKGYEKEPLVGLELACQPLQQLFDVQELAEHIKIAKLNCKIPADGLTHDESASVQLYTMEWTEPSESLYAKLNQTLRTPERNLLKPWFRYLKLFLTALFKLPSVKCQLWRGVKEDLSAIYQKESTHIWWSFSSCTSSLDVLQRPNFIGKTGTRTLFSIEGFTSGKDISRHSYYKNEDEILLLPGTCVEVRSLITRSDNFSIVHLRQVKPPYEVLVPPFLDADSIQQNPNISLESTSKEPLSTVKQSSPSAKHQNLSDDSSDDEYHPMHKHAHYEIQKRTSGSTVSDSSSCQEMITSKRNSISNGRKLQIQKNSKGFVEITYVDRTGNSIIIENTSVTAESDVDMTGWSLRKTIDNSSSQTYPFPDKFIAKSRSPIRIIARNTTKKNTSITRNDGESSLIADNIPSWGVGEYAMTQLLDDQGNEQAVYVQTFT